MAIEVFGDLSVQFHRLVINKDYPTARELIEAHAHHFPEEYWHIYEWRSAAAALCNDPAAAMTILQEAIDKGLWYPVTHLRDEEFSAVQGHVAFEQMVLICEERHKTAQAQTKRQALVSLPTGTSPFPVMLTVHRNHASAARCWLEWNPIVEAGYALVMPQSTVTEGPDIFVWNDRAKAVTEVESHYDGLTGDAQYNLEKIIWAGYMSGADVALRLAFSGRVTAKGFIAISPVLSDVEYFVPLAEAAVRRGLRGYIFAGEEDTRAYSGAKRFARLLHDYGMPLHFEVRPVSFGYPKDFPQVLSTALQFINGTL